MHSISSLGTIQIEEGRYDLRILALIHLHFSSLQRENYVQKHIVTIHLGLMQQAH